MPTTMAMTIHQVNEMPRRKRHIAYHSRCEVGIIS
jgi:hypothetical protein